MMPNRVLLQNIARFAAKGSDFDQLSPELLHISKEMMVNAAAVGLAGAAQADGHTVTKFAQDMGGNGRCTIIGKGLRTSPVYAALTNGVLIRLLDFDDEMPENLSHPGSAVFPVVMALGEMNGLPGQDVLAAFAAGCEVVSRLQSLAVASNETTGEIDSQLMVFSGTAASLGAAAAAGKLLRLSEPGILQALLLASSNSGGNLTVGDAGPAQAFGYGKAAMTGTMSALLVQQGLQATPEFQGPETELLTTASPKESSARAGSLETDLGKPFDAISHGVSLKLYPCTSQAHSVIDAALQLLQQYRFSGDDVSEVRVGVTPGALAALPFPAPANGWQARACVSFVVATALTHGHPLIDNFSDSATANQQVREMMERVSVEATETPMTSIPFPSSVAISLDDGRQLSHRSEFARGLADLPLTTEELDAKFLYCSRYILPPDHIEEAVTRLRDLENIENTTGLFSVLGG